MVKVGSAVLSDGGGLRAEIIHRLAADIDYLIVRGYEVVLVTSGAIAAGRARLADPLNSTIAITAGRRGDRPDRLDDAVCASLRLRISGRSRRSC